MATYKYLDTTGLEQLWSKIKNYVSGLISQPDWNAEEDEEGHVLNRPMWLDLYDNAIFSSEEPTAFVIPSGGSVEVTPIKNYFYDLLHSGGQVTIVTDSGTITSALGHDPINNYYYCGLDTSDFFLFTEDKVELVGRLGTSGTYNISEIRVPYHEVRVKDEYKSVFQADWEETYDSLSSYIKNKPPIHAATGTNSTIIGDTNNQATGAVSIVSGYGNSSSGNYSIANGYNNTISGQYGLANGSGNTVLGQHGIALGLNNKAKNSRSIAHGNYSEASANFAVASGSRTKASGAYSFAFGTNSQVATLFLTGDASATTYSTIVNNQNSVDTLKRLAPSLYVTNSDSNAPIRVSTIVDGNQNLELFITFESTLSTTPLSETSYAFYEATSATGDVSVAMGLANLASNQASTAFGSNNVSSGVASFAEGKSNVASNLQSHAEGYLTVSSSNQSHAEGRGTTASALAAHSEGHGTTASGEASHSENKSTVASGKYTHAQGENTTANGYAETTIGRYNTLSNANAQTAYNTTNSPYILVAGNGTADNARSNAHTLDWSGNGWYAGKLTVGTAPTNNMDVATKQYVDGVIPTVPIASSTTPLIDGTGAVGSSTTYARADHVHPKITQTLSISSNVITLTGSDGSTSSITLPVYNGSVSGGGSS